MTPCSHHKIGALEETENINKKDDFSNEKGNERNLCSSSTSTSSKISNKFSLNGLKKDSRRNVTKKYSKANIEIRFLKKCKIKKLFNVFNMTVANLIQICSKILLSKKLIISQQVEDLVLVFDKALILQNDCLIAHYIKGNVGSFELMFSDAKEKTFIVKQLLSKYEPIEVISKFINHKNEEWIQVRCKEINNPNNNYIKDIWIRPFQASYLGKQ